MNKDNNYKIKKGISVRDYSNLLLDLYKKYPFVVKTKISEYEKTFSPQNPFFKYGVVENHFLFTDEKIVGHISAITDDRSSNIGFIGFFECQNNQKYANVLFENAIKFLKDHNKKECRGSINISVWQNFRVSYPEKNPPFYLEPFTLEYYRTLFLEDEFTVGHQNITTIESIKNTKIKNYENVYSKLIKDGYYFELITEENSNKSIEDIYFLTKKIFKDSYSFYNISKEEFSYFAKQYTKTSKPYYIFILKNREKIPIGFFFAMPDIFNPELKMVTMKTMGVLPEYRGLGLAKSILYCFYKNSKDDGFEKLVFSTMAVENGQIQTLTGKVLTPYRKYEVFERNI